MPPLPLLEKGKQNTVSCSGAEELWSLALESSFFFPLEKELRNWSCGSVEGESIVEVWWLEV